MSKFFIALILFLGLASRFIWINQAPHSINGDQLHYILSSKSFVLTGKDLSQSVSLPEIFMFKYPPNEIIQAELPYALDIFTVGWLPFSMAANALPNAFLSLLTIVIVYLITRKILNEQIAIIAGFMTTINPWFIAIGRTSYEMIPAPFFYLLAFYILLITKGWKILFAIPVLLLAFYSYIATKLIFLPLVFLFCLYCYFGVNKRKFAKQYIVLILILVAFIGFFVLQLKSLQSASRASEIITPFSPFIQEQVDSARKVSIATPFTSLFENKLTVFSKTLFDNTLKTLGYDYLFLKGDYFFTLGQHGLFYAIDFIFVFLGMFWVLAKNKKLFIFLISLAFVSIFPHIFHITAVKNGNFSPHTTMLIPFLIIFISAGIWQSIEFVKKGRKVIGATIIIIYLFLFGNFLNIYFYQLPLQHNFFNFPSRVLSSYASKASTEGQHVLIYTHDPQGKFQEHLFYSNTYNKENINKVTEALNTHKYVINNVAFLACNRDVTKAQINTTVITHVDCEMNISGDRNNISQLSDNGTVYSIINDRICNKSTLKSYAWGIKMNDFDVEKMPLQKFCQTFITAN